MRNVLRAAAAVLLLLVFVGAASCSKPEEPIQVEQNTITILNQSSGDWKDVRITVNDHFGGGVPILKAEGRLNAPLSQFQSGYGQRWPESQRVTKVVVTATDANNQPVKMEWDVNNQQRRK